MGQARRQRRAAEGLSVSSAVSKDTVKVLGKRVWGRKDAMPGALIAAASVPPDKLQWALDNGLAVWVGDAKAELEARDRQRMAAQKAAAESNMQRFDLMDDDERAYARENDPNEGDDVT